MKKNLLLLKDLLDLLKNKISKYMTSISKDVNIDKLDDKVNKYNNAYHRSFNMCPIAVMLSKYFDFKNESPKFEVGEQVKIPNIKFFAKYYTANWLAEVCFIKTLKHTVLWRYVQENFTEKKLLEHFLKNI